MHPVTTKDIHILDLLDKCDFGETLKKRVSHEPWKLLQRSSFQGFTRSFILDRVPWTNGLHVTHVWHNFPIFVRIKACNPTTNICKRAHPSLVFTDFIFGCCKLVVFHSVNGSPHIAATSFLANLLSLMDGEKASRLLVLALPTPCFFSYFSIIVSSWLLQLMIRTSCLYVTSPCLTIGQSPALSKQSLDPYQRWGAGPCCVPAQRSVFLAHNSSSTLSRLFNSSLLWCYLTGEGVCVYSVLSAVGEGGGWWGG